MESLFVMAQVAPTEYPKDNLEKADSLVKEAAEKYHPGMIIFPRNFYEPFSGWYRHCNSKCGCGTAGRRICAGNEKISRQIMMYGSHSE